MNGTCPTCGLPKEICVCQQITKEGTKIKISTERKKFRKYMTIVEGFDPDTDIESLGKELKKKLACGGTVKKNRIELQGNHKDKVKDILLKNGYNEEQIDIY